jgi:hypothetical protein
MTEYTLTSDYNVVTLPTDSESLTRVTPLEDPTGASAIPEYESRITQEARRFIPSIEDKQIAGQADNLIRAINQAIFALQLAGNDILSIPNVRPSISENGSVAFEWILPDFRFGFSIESASDESGWYVATSKRLGDVGAYGLLKNLSAEHLALLVVTFVLANT